VDSRPYQKDDNAHIEPKNWTHVRRQLGYQCYDSPLALEALNALYEQELRLFQNLLLPSVKLRQKVRVGSKLKRVYDTPQIPFQRVCASEQALPAKVAQLQHWRDTLDPFELSRQIEQKLERIFQLSSCQTAPKDASDPQASPVSTTVHRKKKELKKKEGRTATTLSAYILFCSAILLKVTFLLRLLQFRRYHSRRLSPILSDEWVTFR
jgi:hypothetical protein